MDTDLTGVIDSKENDPTVISLFEMMREAIKGKSELTVAQVLSYYKEYFESKGYVKTIIGWIPEEDWIMLLKSGMVEEVDGEMRVVRIVKEEQDKNGNTIRKIEYPIQKYYDLQKQRAKDWHRQHGATPQE